jgi:hypothetical protein
MQGCPGKRQYWPENAEIHPYPSFNMRFCMPVGYVGPQVFWLIN